MCAHPRGLICELQIRLGRSLRKTRRLGYAQSLCRFRPTCIRCGIYQDPFSVFNKTVLFRIEGCLFCFLILLLVTRCWLQRLFSVSTRCFCQQKRCVLFSHLCIFCFPTHVGLSVTRSSTLRSSVGLTGRKEVENPISPLPPLRLL